MPGRAAVANGGWASFCLVLKVGLFLFTADYYGGYYPYAYSYYPYSYGSTYPYSYYSCEPPFNHPLLSPSVPACPSQAIYFSLLALARSGLGLVDRAGPSDGSLLNPCRVPGQRVCAKAALLPPALLPLSP